MYFQIKTVLIKYYDLQLNKNKKAIKPPPSNWNVWRKLGKYQQKEKFNDKKSDISEIFKEIVTQKIEKTSNTKNLFILDYLHICTIVCLYRSNIYITVRSNTI